jgi:hypothetical protein
MLDNSKNTITDNYSFLKHAIPQRFLKSNTHPILPKTNSLKTSINQPTKRELQKYGHK